MSILLLAGTTEAHQIAERLSNDGYHVIASLAGATTTPKPFKIQTRTGGFGGGEGFMSFIFEHKIKAVIDATHPYAAQITTRTAALCTRHSIPYIHLLRPKWIPQKGDDWTEIVSPEDALQYIHSWQTVFLTTGRNTFSAFSGLAGRRVICRVIDPPTTAEPFTGGEFLISRPPFQLKTETSLLKDLKVDWLIAKNSGGTSSKAKLVAARQMRIPVLMLKRPYDGGASCVPQVDDVISWAHKRPISPPITGSKS